MGDCVKIALDGIQRVPEVLIGRSEDETAVMVARSSGSAVRRWCMRWQERALRRRAGVDLIFHAFDSTMNDDACEGLGRSRHLHFPAHS